MFAVNSRLKLALTSGFVVILSGLLLLTLWLRPDSAIAANKTELHWYGHSAFKITTPSGKVVLLDPWLNNPVNKTAKADLANLGRVDLILVSHGHFDHVGDAVEIGKKTGAKLVTTFDLGRSIAQHLGYPKDAVGYDSQGNFGGTVSFFNGEVGVTFVSAVHSSAIAPQEAQGDSFSDLTSAGNPGGFLVQVKNGPTIYHTGDTDLFSDMSLLSRFNKVTVMLACIGDHFTMGPERAAEAVKLVKPAMVVPMHFGTFPVLTGTPQAFKAALNAQGAKSQLKIMQVGESLKL